MTTVVGTVIIKRLSHFFRKKNFFPHLKILTFPLTLRAKMGEI